MLTQSTRKIVAIAYLKAARIPIKWFLPIQKSGRRPERIADVPAQTRTTRT